MNETAYSRYRILVFRMKYPSTPRKTQTKAVLASRVTIMRRAWKWSQAELARQAGLPVSTVNEIENGVTRDPRASTLYKIAQALHVSPDYLYGVEPVRAHQLGMIPAMCIGCAHLPPDTFTTSKKQL